MVKVTLRLWVLLVSVVTIFTRVLLTIFVMLYKQDLMKLKSSLILLMRSNTMTYFIFKPINKYGDIDYSRKQIIYDSSYVRSIDIVCLSRKYKVFVYVIYRKDMPKIYLSCRQYKITVGVNV